MPQRNAIQTGSQYALAVAGTAVSLTVPAGGADYCFITCETAQVRWTDDGTTPTSAVGHPLNAGQTLEYDGHPENLKFIRTTSTSAALNVSYYSGS